MKNGWAVASPSAAIMSPRRGFARDATALPIARPIRSMDVSGIWPG